MFYYFTFFLVFSFHTLNVHAQAYKPYEEGSVHEAFITKTGGSISLDSVPTEPPAPITERIPPQKEPQTQWIPGYWAYDEDINDFYWISGVWRRPPPNHQWIPGFWKQVDEGWVWIKGFWSPQPLDSISFISDPPPDQPDDEISSPPGDNYFWSPGYWVYNESTENYDWLPGDWVESDPNWVLVPGHYLWRPEGYLFIPPYWDWPFDRAGTLYSNIFVASPIRTITYEPTLIIEPVIIVLRLFPYYPDFPYLFWHHHHYYPSFWSDFPVTPPWWSWPTWWGNSWHNQWGLWWWYSHPGYPQPYWLGPEIVNIIPPPPAPLFNLFKKVNPPFIVTPNGVVRPRRFFDEYTKIRGRGKVLPVVPANKNVLEKIKSSIEPKERPSKIYTPDGSKDRYKTIHPKMPVIKSDIPANRILRKETRFVNKPDVPNIPSRFTPAPQPQKKEIPGLPPIRQIQKPAQKIERQSIERQQIQRIEPPKPVQQIPERIQRGQIEQQQQIERIEPPKPVQEIRERIQRRQIEQQQQIQRIEPPQPAPQIPERIQRRQIEQQQQIPRIEPQQPVQQIPERIQRRQIEQQQQIQKIEPPKPVQQIPERIQRRQVEQQPQIQRIEPPQPVQQIPERIQRRQIEQQQQMQKIEPPQPIQRHPENIQPEPRARPQSDKREEQKKFIEEQLEKKKQK